MRQDELTQRNSNRQAIMEERMALLTSALPDMPKGNGTFTSIYLLFVNPAGAAMQVDIT